MKKKLTVLLLASAIFISAVPVTALADSGFAIEDTDVLPETDYGGPVGLAITGDDETSEGGGALPAEEPEDKLVNLSEAGSFSGKWYAADGETAGSDRISRKEAARCYADDEEVTFIVVTDRRPLTQIYSPEDIAGQTSAVINSKAASTAALNAVAEEMDKALGGNYELGYTYTVATTALSVTTVYGNREALESLPGVEYVYVAPTFFLTDDDTPLEPMTGNATGMIGAPAVNSSGYTGKGQKSPLWTRALLRITPASRPCQRISLPIRP